MILWTLASRNVLRNRRRSVITALSIAIGLAALTFLWAFIDGMNLQMVENSTRYFAGDVQVHRKGYHADPSLDRAVDDGAQLLARVRDDPDASARLKVRGIYRSQIDELDGYVVVMPLAAMREFLSAPEATTAIAVKLRDRSKLASASMSLQQRVGARHEVVGWPVLLPMVTVSVRYHEVMGYVVLVVFFVMVAAGVANPVLMAVLERTREFGVLLALGTSQARLLRMVLYEAVLLGAAGLIAGNVIGLSVTLLFGHVGIDLSAFAAGLRSMPGLADVIYPVLRPERSALISALVFLIAAVVALYPAVPALHGLAIEGMRAAAGPSSC